LRGFPTAAGILTPSYRITVNVADLLTPRVAEMDAFVFDVTVLVVMVKSTSV